MKKGSQKYQLKSYDYLRNEGNGLKMYFKKHFLAYYWGIYNKKIAFFQFFFPFIK